jgi:hypothetical protein
MKYRVLEIQKVTFWSEKEKNWTPNWTPNERLKMREIVGDFYEDRIYKKEPLEKFKKWNNEIDFLFRIQTIFQNSLKQK